MKSKAKSVLKVLLILLVPLLVIAIWAGIEVSQDCRGHHIFISRTHNDDLAVTKVSFKDKEYWQGVPTRQYQEVIIPEVVEGSFDVTTIFSDGTKRKSHAGFYVTTADSEHHYVNIGKLEDASVDKTISLFWVAQDVLSCSFMN